MGCEMLVSEKGRVATCQFYHTKLEHVGEIQKLIWMEPTYFAEEKLRQKMPRTSHLVHVHEFKLSNVQKSLVVGIKVVVADAVK